MGRMKMRMAHIVLLCVILVLMILTVLCHLIALVTSVWLKSSTPTETNFLNIGLFWGCFENYVHPHENPPKLYDGCHQLESDYYKNIQDWLVPSWLISCRVLAVIALILQIIGVILVLLLLIWILCEWICCDSEQDCCERFLVYSAPIVFILAGMFLMMTVMIFADNAFRLQCKDFWVGGDPANNYLAWSWGFEVAATVFAFLTGGLLIWLVVLKSRDDI